MIEIFNLNNGGKVEIELIDLLETLLIKLIYIFGIYNYLNLF